MPTYAANMTVSGFSGNHYQHQIIIDVLSQDLGLNRTLIRRRQRLARIGTVEAWNNTNSSTRSIDTSGQPNSGTFSYDFRGQPSNHVITLLDQNIWISHDPNGKKQLVTSGLMNVTGMKAAANIGAQYFDLPDIPRGPERFDGSAWKPQILERWDGAQWKQQILERFDGTNWKVQG